jgi:hypothetical protein
MSSIKTSSYCCPVLFLETIALLFRGMSTCKERHNAGCLKVTKMQIHFLILRALDVYLNLCYAQTLHVLSYSWCFLLACDL